MDAGFIVDIPGRGVLSLDHLVLDLNGTIALDGQVIEGVGDALEQIAERCGMHIWVVTADTHGTAAARLEGLPCQLEKLGEGAHDLAKAAVIERLGPTRCVAIGNGANDHLMLQRAALGVALCQPEGLAIPTLLAADLLCPSILDALALLLSPKRLIASLRL